MRISCLLSFRFEIVFYTETFEFKRCFQSIGLLTCKKKRAPFWKWACCMGGVKTTQPITVNILMNNKELEKKKHTQPCLKSVQEEEEEAVGGRKKKKSKHLKRFEQHHRCSVLVHVTDTSKGFRESEIWCTDCCLTSCCIVLLFRIAAPIRIYPDGECLTIRFSFWFNGESRRGEGRVPNSVFLPWRVHAIERLLHTIPSALDLTDLVI